MKIKIVSIDFKNMIIEFEQLNDSIEQKEKTLKKVKKSENPNLQLSREIWDAYRTAYFERYAKDPVRNGMVNKQIQTLASRLGLDAINVVEFYLKHNDTFYVKSCHSLGLCLRDAESLHTQWTKGVAITGAKLRAFEKRESFNETMKQIDEVGV